MARMKVYDDRNSPAASRVTLSRMKNTVGDVPALAGVLAGAPGVLDSCTEFTQRFMQSSLKLDERFLVLLVASREFGNEYSFELVLGMTSFSKLSAHITSAVKNRKHLRKKAHRALGEFVEAVIREGGDIRDEELEGVRKAGYSEQQVLEIMMGVSVAWIWSNVSGVAGLSPDAKSDE